MSYIFAYHSYEVFEVFGYKSSAALDLEGRFDSVASQVIKT